MKAKGIFTGTERALPGKGMRGEITVPGDKSISHRAVMLGSIAEGPTEISGFLEGEDNLSTIEAFRLMGVRIERDGGRVSVEGRGLEGLSEPEDVINAGNSGTTTRLLLGLLAGRPFFSAITGDASLRKRPMKRVVDPLRMMGASISGRKDGSLLPLAVSGGRLNGIEYRTPVASAQLKSALLLAGLSAGGETVIEEPEKSRDHTERMLGLFGADIRTSGNSVSIKSTNRLRGCKIIVPGDISSAAFFLAGAALAPESELLIRQVGINPTRVGIIDILRKMGGSIEVHGGSEASGEPVGDILVRGTRLRGADISGTELLPAIDEFPILCVAAAFAEGTTTISGAAELRVKESDRIAAMSECLSAIGVRNTETEDGMVIEGTGGKRAAGGSVKSRGDHRVAMAMAIAALMTEGGVSMEGAGCVDVSFPGFFELLERTRVE